VISRSYNTALLLTGLLAISAYCTAASLPVLAMAILPGFALGWWLSSRERRRLLFPRRIVNILLTLAVAYAVLVSLQQIQIETIAQLVMFMQLIKLGDRRGPRDDGQIIALCVFLAIAAMLDSNSLPVGVQLIALLPILVGTIMLYQIESGRNGDGPWRTLGERDRGVLVPPPQPRLWRRTAGVTLLATFSSIAAAAIIFIVMPRGVGENVLGRMHARGASDVTGFTNVVKLGQGRVISTSPTPVLDFSIRDADGTNLAGPGVVYYLRGAVLDEYDAGTWTTGPTARTRSPRIPPGVIGRRGEQMTVQSVHVRARITPGEWTPLFTAGRPVSLEMAPETHIRVNDDDSIAEVQARPPFSYIVHAAMAEPRPLGELVRTGVSFDVEPIRALAAEILARREIDPDPAARPVDQDVAAARAILDHLRFGYAYTLVEPEVVSPSRAIEEFLFRTRRGHCEYFASAMVALCRSVGINARMIAGYVAAEYVEGSGHYTVRQSNAHAWVEVDGGRDSITGISRWVTLDPTPPADFVLQHSPRPTLVGRIRQMFDAVEYAWTTSIVSFSQREQRQIFGDRAISGTGGPFRSLNRLARRVQQGGARLLLVATATGVIVFAAVALAGFGILKLGQFARWARSRLAPGFISRQRAAHDPRFYRQFLSALDRRGYPKPDSLPPLAHAQAIAARDPQVAEHARALTDLYYRVRFRGDPLTREDRESARRAVRELRRRRAPAT
jgi:protein-glutamine gamma-glutamyltransferase